MSEAGLHIDTHSASSVGPKTVEHEHNTEEVNKHSVAHSTVDPESSSEETEESSLSDDSDEVVQDLSPTTTYHPEPHEHDLEKHSESTTVARPVEHEPSTQETSQELPDAEERDTKAENLHQEPAKGETVAVHTEPENTNQGPSEKDEAEDQPISTPVENELPIETAQTLETHHTTSVKAELEHSEEGTLEEKSLETPQSSIVEVEGAPKEILTDPLHPAEIEPETTSEKEIHESTAAREIKPEDSVDAEILASSTPDPVKPEVTAETPVSATEIFAKPDETTATEASKEAPKPSPNDREKRALDTVKRSRIQFRAALDIFLQLINENEDDEGTIRLNLVQRDSDLRKTVGMLGLKLQNLVEAERELDWAQLLDRYESREKA